MIRYTMAAGDAKANRDLQDRMIMARQLKMKRWAREIATLNQAARTGKQRKMARFFLNMFGL